MASSLLAVDGQWRVDKYGRFLRSIDPTCAGAGDSKDAGKGDSKEAGEWKIIETSPEKPLMLSLLKNGSLLVHHGRDVLENHSLLNSGEWWRAVRKGDSILYIYKIKDETRKFRIKVGANDVMTGVENCEKVADRFGAYLAIKDMSSPVDSGQGQGQISGDKESTSDAGMTTIQTTAKLITDSATRRRNLPLAYSECNLHGRDINSLLRLCLSDSGFPAFVGLVEKQLQTIVGEKRSSGQP